jgi:hypothetical protein
MFAMIKIWKKMYTNIYFNIIKVFYFCHFKLLTFVQIYIEHKNYRKF